MELSEALQIAYEHGCFWNPDFPALHHLEPEQLGGDRSPLNRIALQSLSQSYFNEYAEACAIAHNRIPWHDGELGPAFEMMLASRDNWCSVPNYPPPPGLEFNFDDPYLQEVCEQMQADQGLPAIGVGNWKSCHGIGNYHSATVDVDMRGIGSHLQDLFQGVLANVQRAYAEIGLLFIFVDNGVNLLTGEPFSGNINIGFSFVQRSNGWIGLAIVGENQTCQSQIWCRYLATYKPSNVAREWVTLIKHELGHNCGMQHTRGGVMNPSIVAGLPTEWTTDDPSYGYLRRNFGGEPVEPDTPPDKWAYGSHRVVTRANKDNVVGIIEVKSKGPLERYTGDLQILDKTDVDGNDFIFTPDVDITPENP